MNRLSLKIKLTLLYTFFMILATSAVLAILFSLSSREILASAQSKLERRVQDSSDDITLRDGELRLDSDFYSVTQDVYLSLYDENMYFLYGKVPYGFDVQPEIADGRTRRIPEGDTDWYVYDMSFRLAEDYTVYVRGITSVTDAEATDGAGDGSDRISYDEKNAPACEEDHGNGAEDPRRCGSVPQDRTGR